MDATCSVCGNVSDDAQGACRLCGTPFAPLSKKEKKAAEAEEPEPKGKGK